MTLPQDKLAFHIDEAVEAGAGSRSEIYEALRDGRLSAKKRGRRTIILRDELERYLDDLPDYVSESGSVMPAPTNGGGGAVASESPKGFNYVTTNLDGAVFAYPIAAKQ